MAALRKFDIRRSGKVILIVLGVWLFINAGVWLGLVSPKTKQLAAFEQEQLPRLTAEKARKKQVEESEGYYSALVKAEEDLAHLREQVLSTKRSKQVEAQLEMDRIAKQFGVDMARVQYENSELLNEALDRFAMTAPLEGGYGNLRRFIQAVESSKLFLVIERVDLEQGKDGGVMLQLNITVAAYFDSPQLREKKAGSTRRGGDDKPRGRT